ncbi:YjbH domain-containing protein [Ramlibacter tataouinensis]|uniref:YjbH domain-containing protein n=1 Tax=Ramlibacter tataouinensis TaxID=94132 RepID=UPI0022F39A8E|nr:YjbH domain-containing protein [Ramlibacter tataouinensis]WBY02072.1 YjbH domain-containing protein [Ramlibacter tataouinensis]
MRVPKRSQLTAIALGLVALRAAAAVDTTMTPAGYTGLGITPNAHLLGWGRLEATYDNQLPGVVANTRGHNYVVGFGLMPNLEISGRLATNTLDSNCFIAPGCGVRDLSGSGKVAIGLDAANRFRIAAGATDVGGAATNFRTYYGVLTYNEGPVEASVGWARRSGARAGGPRSPLDGPFAAAAWQPLPLVRGHVEYADGNAWAGVRVFAPSEWLPEGWSLSAGANFRLNENRLTERAWWTTSLSIPLYKVPALPGTRKAPLPPLQPGQHPLPAYEARIAAPLDAERTEAPSSRAQADAPAQAPSVPGPNPQPLTDDRLHALGEALQAKGLEDIWVGRMPDGTVAVRANNASYAWNALDALGAALGAIARGLGDSKAGYRLVLTQRQLPIVAVTGQADCLREWIEQPTNSCTAGQLSTPGTMPLDPLHEGASWVVQRQKPAWQTVRVSVSPVLRTTVGTEVGALDYQVGANVNALLPLWPGASVDWGVNIPLAHSDDFEARGVFANRRIPSGTERLAFTQTARIPLERWLAAGEQRRWGGGALTAQATVGRIGSFYDGALGALRWEPGEGRHRLGAEAGLFRNNAFDNGRGPLGTLRRAAPVLGSYRYSFMPTRTDLEATAGRFMNNDRGFQVGLRQWFADTAVSIYYRRTSFPGQSLRQMVGITLSLPIGPRRDWQPIPHVQVGGTPRFTHRVETVIRDKANPLSFGHGMHPPTSGLDAVFNSDRASLVYFEDNMRRIRDAAR